MFAILTLKMHLPPEYVLDKMEMYEVRALMKYEYYTDIESWQQARLISYIIAQVNSKKRLTPQSIMKLPCDENYGHKGDTTLSNEESKRLRERAVLYENHFKSMKR